jgi:hypothetical protein
MRRTLALIGIVSSIACSTPTTPRPTPTPTPTPPPALLTVSGSVSDAVYRRVADVRIEVVSGPQQGTMTFSDDAGNFAIEPKLSPLSQIRASKQGYVESTQFVAGAGPTVDLKFFLSSANPPLNITGTYEVTFIADATCTELPDLARRRTYSATIGTMSPIGPVMQFFGARFGSSGGLDWNIMPLRQFDDYLELWADHPPVVEMLADNAYYMVYGGASGTVTREFAELRLGADIGYCPKLGAGSLASLSCEVPMVNCRSTRHQMTLTRQNGSGGS